LIFLDTNVVSETMKRQPDSRIINWIVLNAKDIALPTVTIAEICFGIEKIAEEVRAQRFASSLTNLCTQFAIRIYSFDEKSAHVYGRLMAASERRGRPMETQDCMIAAITLSNNARLATRNGKDFVATGVPLVDPWNA
jgi:predicted nucleic acid-binding protein